jgi:hypothetical protein
VDELTGDRNQPPSPGSVPASVPHVGVDADARAPTGRPPLRTLAANSGRHRPSLSSRRAFALRALVTVHRGRGAQVYGRVARRGR